MAYSARIPGLGFVSNVRSNYAGRIGGGFFNARAASAAVLVLGTGALTFSGAPWAVAQTTPASVAIGSAALVFAGGSWNLAQSTVTLPIVTRYTARVGGVFVNVRARYAGRIGNSLLVSTAAAAAAVPVIPPTRYTARVNGVLVNSSARYSARIGNSFLTSTIGPALPQSVNLPTGVLTFSGGTWAIARTSGSGVTPVVVPRKRTTLMLIGRQ